MAHQQIDCSAQRGVGADARIPVAATALQAHGQVAQGHGLARRAVRLGQHGFDQCHAFVNRLARAACVLDVEGGQLHVFLQTFLRDQACDLVGLAAQAHHQHGRKVGVLGVAAQGAAQHMQFFAIAGGGASHAVGQRDHAIDVGKVGQGFGANVASKVIGNGTRRCGRAIDRGQHADVVARGHTTVRTHDALERGGLVHIRGGLRGGAGCVLTCKVTEGQVVRVHMFARGNVACRHANDLVVTTHRLPFGNRASRHFVARRHQARDGHALLRQHRATHQLRTRNDHVVLRMDADDG